MPADAPTILATSGGLRAGHRSWCEFAPLVHHAVELSGAHGRSPRVVHVGTATGDQRWFNAEVDEAARIAGFDLTSLNLFPMPTTDDVEGLLTSADVIWVGGGSVVNLLAVWKAHGLGDVMRRAWRAGVVLTGVSAGSICWHVGGTTDSYGPTLRPVTDALGFLPWGNGVHYDAEPQRRPLIQKLVREGTLPTSYCTDDGVGLVYQGAELVGAVSEVVGKGAYVVTCEGGRVVEERIEPKILPGAITS